MPVLTLGAEYVPAFRGNPNTVAENGMKMLAQNVTGIIVSNSGYFIQEEQPDVVVKGFPVNFCTSYVNRS
jgi:hypothetical protein